ncbi:MAG: DUF3987 domain-containing protein [Actinomycetia bacterium]|nr:DUF3987 domain-containing protein [Actinomycetes bacterium]
MTPDTSPALAAVLERDLHIFPLAAGTKAGQHVASWARDASNQIGQAEQWLDRWPTMNYGIHCGLSGLIVLDADGQPAVDSVETWASEEHWDDILADTLCVTTPGGGLHWYFRDTNPPTRSQPGGNQANPITATGERLHHVDWRSSNGYVVGPGSTRADRNGDTYQIVQPAGWATPIHPAPAALLDACRRTHQPPPNRSPKPATPNKADGPWTAYDHDVLPEQVFEEHGWQRVRTNSPKERARYRRPDATSASSATIFADTGGITIWSSNAGAVDQHYSGSAALKAGLMYPTMSVDDAKERFVEWLHDQTSHTRRNTAAPDLLEPADWPEPDPLPATDTPPPFPAEILPPVLADAANTITRALELDIDLGALIGIGCLSAVATWADLRLDITPTRSTGPNIYQAISLPPSAGKSPVFGALTTALWQIARTERQRSEQSVTKAQQRRKIAEQRVRNAETAAVKDSDLEHLAWAAQLDLEHIDTPTIRRLIADDITPEALGELLADNGGHLAVISAEGDFFDGLGRYAERGREPNISAPLKAWSGDPIIVNRAGGREYEVHDPRIAMTLTVQPAVVKALWANDQFAGRGLVHRVMVAQPAHRVGSRTFDNPEADQQTLAAWAAHLETLHGSLTSGSRYQLTPDAYQAYKAWQREHEAKLTDGWERIVSSVSKIEDTALRVALLLHLCTDPTSVEVDLHDLERAMQVGDYWIGQLLAIQPAPDWYDPMRRVLEWCDEENRSEFTIRDLSRSGILRRDYGAKHAELTPIIGDMIDAGWVAPAGEGWNVPKKGTPAVPLRVNPKVARQCATTSHHERSLTAERRKVVAHVALSREGYSPNPSLPNTPTNTPPQPEHTQSARQLDNHTPQPHKAVSPNPKPPPNPPDTYGLI